jgi:UrcA family protein
MFSPKTSTAVSVASRISAPQALSANRLDAQGAPRLRWGLGVGLTLVAVLLAGAPAAAEGLSYRARSPATDRVLYADLDLNSADGAHAMFRRIQAAASRACALVRSPTLPAAAAEVNRCRRQAIESGVRRLNAPKVTAVYARVYTAAPATLTATR